MRPQTIALPVAPKCPKCKAVARWEFVDTPYGKPQTVQLQAMHECTCPESDYQKELAACLASGGHDPETHSAGQHSFDQCRKCGHHV